jgi:phosphoribosylformimino-5-aminoimidazole carboxamide ribotide isomerase
MTILPAIDLKDGRCVRLRQGDMATAVVYGDDPVAMAWRWVSEGAEYLHVVDLDGAFAGHPVNEAVVHAICRAVPIPVQVGGGVRDAATARTVLDAGAARVILGTVAYSTPVLVEALSRELPGRIAVGIDARGDEAAGQGWNEPSGLNAVTLAEQAARAGVACVIYTDIARDGTEVGPNIEATRAMVRALAVWGVPLIASGGVGSLADVKRVAALGPEGVAGLIIGRALYTGSVSLPEALAIASREESSPKHS